MDWQGAQLGWGTAELVLLGPALVPNPGEVASLAGEPSSYGEEVPSGGLVGCHYLSNTDAPCASDCKGRRENGPRGRPDRLVWVSLSSDSVSLNGKGKCQSERLVTG